MSYAAPSKSAGWVAHCYQTPSLRDYYSMVTQGAVSRSSNIPSACVINPSIPVQSGIIVFSLIQSGTIAAIIPISPNLFSSQIRSPYYLFPEMLPEMPLELQKV